ncbi:MAG: glutamate--tRNA ligase [Alphaproteobacteria bacterium]|nr:glutamate--tRNA ligase [Alphaproteobacteria bacterium]
MTVVTRFAPSPTGYLHIGGARTALFNWLFARHHQGKFLLRIEDTDRERSTDAAIAAILAGMKWLGLDWDGEEFYQFARAPRHAEVAQQMVAMGKAYYCYMTPEEIEAERAKAKAEGKMWKYDGRWRDRDPKDAPAGVKPVVRLKAPREGETVNKDQVQGDVVIKNEQLDDMVMLRSDGTPTYMLAVVVDDHDMGVTHIIRGDDHLTNAARQMQIYQAMGWDVPIFAHIPLIHGPDGAKLSKRHGALGVEEYEKMGYLPEAMRNYLLRLGWSHGDDEIISDKQAVEWFNLESVGQSPSRFDFTKLESLNGHYMREADDARLVKLIAPLIEVKLSRKPDDAAVALLTRAMPGLKARAKTLLELADNAAFYVMRRPLPLNDKAKKLLEEGKPVLAALLPLLETASDWTAHALEAAIKAHAETAGLKLGKVAQPLRAALSGSDVSPPIFEVMEILGKEETLGRIRDNS